MDDSRLALVSKRLQGICVGTVALAGILGWGERRADAALLYVSSTSTGQVMGITTGGTESAFAGPGLGRPTGLAFDSAGNLYEANNSSYTLKKYTPAGVGSTVSSGVLAEPRGVALDGLGNIYVANYDFDPATGSAYVEKITPDGTASRFADVGNSPWGLAFDQAGNLYVAIGSNNTIQKITPDGAVSTFVSSGLNEPFGLTFDPAGNLYAANFGGTTVTKITPDGVTSVYANTAADPAGLAFDSSGNLFVSAENNGFIEEITPDGKSSVFAILGLDNPTFLAFGPEATFAAFAPVSVPEPGTLGLLGAGLFGLMLQRGRKRPK